MQESDFVRKMTEAATKAANEENDTPFVRKMTEAATKAASAGN
jgi:hypothetical protein